MLIGQHPWQWNDIDLHDVQSLVPCDPQSKIHNPKSRMQKTVVINIVGLTPSLIGAHTPRLRAFAKDRRIAAVAPSVPAVTCTVQSTYLTGKHPSEHGIVGNG